MKTACQMAEMLIVFWRTSVTFHQQCQYTHDGENKAVILFAMPVDYKLTHKLDWTRVFGLTLDSRDSHISLPISLSLIA